MRARRGIERGLVIGVVVLLVLVLGIGYYLSSVTLTSSTTTSAPPPPSTTTSASTTSTSSVASVVTVTTGNTTSTTSYGLVITNMYADIIGAAFQAPYTNSSSVGDNSFYRGTPGSTIQVEFDVIYQLCASGSCPSQLTAVVAVQHGFTVVPPTIPPMPVSCNATIGTNLECEFLVNVQTPSTPYNGPLTLVAEG